MWDMTHWYMWHDASICVSHSYVWHDSFICVTWLMHICDMTHSYVWHDSFISVTRFWTTNSSKASGDSGTNESCDITDITVYTLDPRTAATFWAIVASMSHIINASCHTYESVTMWHDSLFVTHLDSGIYDFLYLSLTRVLFLSHTHTLSLSHTHSLALTHTLFLSHTHTPSLLHTHSLSLTHTLPVSHTHTYSLSHTHSLSLTHTLPLSHTHTPSLSHTHTEPRTAATFRVLVAEVGKRTIQVRKVLMESGELHLCCIECCSVTRTVSYMCFLER